MNEARYAHTTTLLSDGRVLIIGGIAQDRSRSLSSAEIYDPVLRTFSRTAELNNERFAHTATLLDNGSVLVVAGAEIYARGYAYVLRSAEEYDPATGSFIETDSLPGSGRSGHTATLLQDGRVLVAGGSAGGIRQINYLYRESASSSLKGVFDYVSDLRVWRSAHLAIRLRSSPACPGPLLIAGGWVAVGPQVTNAVEIFDPYLLSFLPINEMNHPRQQVTATLLNDGRVLVEGGTDGNEKMDSAEIFEPIGACN